MEDNMNDIKLPIAYSGKYIDYKCDTYFLVSERIPGGCRGCDLINAGGCTKELTDYCRQGFIFKKVK